MNTVEKKEVIWTGHCKEGNHNKVYVVVSQHVDDNHHLSVYWGKVGNSFQSQEKGTFPNKIILSIEADKIIKQKLKNGYVNVSSLEYKGEVKAHIIARKIGLIEDATIESFKPKVEYGLPKEFVVMCINNKGIEAHFDLQVEYLAYPSPTDTFYKSMYLVEDKFGLKQLWEINRFKIVKE